MNNYLCGCCAANPRCSGWWWEESRVLRYRYKYRNNLFIMYFLYVIWASSIETKPIHAVGHNNVADINIRGPYLWEIFVDSRGLSAIESVRHNITLPLHMFHSRG